MWEMGYFNGIQKKRSMKYDCKVKFLTVALNIPLQLCTGKLDRVVTQYEQNSYRLQNTNELFN